MEYLTTTQECLDSLHEQIATLRSELGEPSSHCEYCKEKPDCCVSTDGTCAQIRVYQRVAGTGKALKYALSYIEKSQGAKTTAADYRHVMSVVQELQKSV